MKKLSILIVLFTFSAATHAQQLPVLKQKFLPKHTYSINNKTAMLMQITMHSDSAAKATGGSGDETIEMKYQTENNTDLNTAEALADKSIPVDMSKTLVVNYVAVNNQVTPSEPDLLAGKAVNGTIDAAGQVHADTTKTPTEVNAFIKGMVEALPSAINFPEKQLKVGGTFTREESGYTVDLTYQGIKKDFPMNVIYKLTDIKDGQLSFETSSVFEINHNAEYQGRAIKIEGKGKSSGKYIFDSRKSYPLYRAGQIDVAFEVNSDKAQAKFKNTVWHEEKVNVSAN